MRSGRPRLRVAGRGGGEEALAAEIRDLVRSALRAADAAAGPAAGEHPSEYAVASYLEGHLSGPAEEVFETHVARCPDCAEELVMVRRAAAAHGPSHSRRLWKIAAGIAVVAGGLIAALLAAGAMGGKLDATVLAGIQGAFGDKIRIEGAKVTLAGGPGVELSNLTVPDPSGGAPIVTASSARWTVDVGDLGRGKVSGSLHLHGAIINVVREASGGLNIDAFLPRANESRDLIEEARRDAVRSVEVSGGTLRLIDRSGDARREIRMAAVDASLTEIGGTSPAHVKARAGLESTRQNLRVSGEMGPWGGERKPAYRFPEVALDGVSMRNLPGIGSMMRGGLSFDGALESSGDNWNEISNGFSGQGEMRVVAGSFTGRNLAQDLVSPLFGVPGPDGAPTAPSGDLAILLASNDTEFAELHSPVRIAGSRIEANDFVATGNGYSVSGRGSLGMDGRVAFSGQIDVTAGTTREILALAPGAGALVNDHGEISVPFNVSGTWPSVRVSVDVEKLARRSLLDRIYAFFFRTPDPLRG